MGLRKFTSKKIGQAIKEIRRALNMSQEEFGMAAGSYSQDTVAKWEAGQVPHAMVLKWISDLSDPFRSVDWILSRNSLKGRSIPRSAGNDNYSSDAREEIGHDPEMKRNMLPRKRRYGETAGEGRYRTGPAPTGKEAGDKSPFDIFTDQLRLLVREEVQVALKNGNRIVDLSAIAFSPHWLRAVGLSRQHARQGNGFKRRSTKAKSH